MRRRRLIVAAAAATVLTALVAPAARADRLAGPGDCAGIQTVGSGFRLTRDVTCDFFWTGSNTVLNLNNHTLTGSFLPQGTGQTIRNGSLVATVEEYWASATDFTMSHVSVTPSGPAVNGFMIEAGPNLTIAHSVIANAPIGLDFYFGNGGTVRDTSFTGNGIGLSVQKSNSVTVAQNAFSGNQTGLRLWNEDSFGVSNTTIRHNSFDANSGSGLDLTLKVATSAATGLNNIIGANTFTNSGGSGLSASLLCQGTASGSLCPGAGTLIRANTFRNNGFTPSAGAPFADDGVTARASVFPYAGGSQVPFPAGLAGITVTGNQANRNADLGLDVTGVTDGGANQARLNGNPAQCEGVVCNLAAGATSATKAAAVAQRGETIGSGPLFIHH